jgi:hypothetical protein
VMNHVRGSVGVQPDVLPTSIHILSKPPLSVAGVVMQDSAVQAENIVIGGWPTFAVLAKVGTNAARAGIFIFDPRN